MNRKRALAWIVGSSLVLAGASALGGDDQIHQPCIPPVWTSSPAECTFNIWGYVKDEEGRPFANMTVSDGSPAGTTRTDSNGFYDLFETLYGTYSISTGRSGCIASAVVNVQLIPALEQGGKRQDFTLPCSP